MKTKILSLVIILGAMLCIVSCRSASDRLADEITVLNEGCPYALGYNTEITSIAPRRLRSRGHHHARHPRFRHREPPLVDGRHQRSHAFSNQDRPVIFHALRPVHRDRHKPALHLRQHQSHPLDRHHNRSV